MDQWHRGARPRIVERRPLFFLRGSGYPEGYLFPWVVSDFSLMDAIESGIVKLPRVPVTDNLVGVDTVVYRDLWKHIGKDLPKTAAGAAKLSAFDLLPMLRTALTTLYNHYAGGSGRWERAGIGVPPVFIVVCQNTAISKLVFDWIAGFERGDAAEVSARPSMSATWSSSGTLTTKAAASRARARC